MTRAALVGFGRMGRMVADCIAQRPDWTVVGVVETVPENEPSAPQYASLADVPEADVAIDFSYPGDLAGLLAAAVTRRIPLVIGRTGLTAPQLAQIRDAAGHVAIVQAGNFSLGVTVMCRMAREMAAALGEDFDIEIVETHHRGKLDSPSGTAMMLRNAVDPQAERPVLHGRSGAMEARSREIGIHALRGGTVSGDHSIHFLGAMESLTLSHRAESREVFAIGALRAAAFARDAAPGLYSMEDVLFGGIQ